MAETESTLTIRRTPTLEVTDDESEPGTLDGDGPAVRRGWFSGAIPGNHRRPAFKGPRVGMD